MTGDAKLPEALARDYRSADLTPEDRVMLDYVVRLTTDPYAAHDGAATLRAAGFGDRAILDICQIAAYYNYVNRLADGLDVQLEDHWSDSSLTMTRADFDLRRHEREEAP